jgi:acetyl-CoA carboxylase biotin carboxyl carrier protein
LDPDRDRILELVQMLKASSAAELTVEEGGVRVRIVRACAAGAGQAPAAALGDSVVLIDVNGAPVTPDGQPLPAAGPEPVTVRSRLVGLFYRGKGPGAAPLAQVGQAVAEDQVLGIVEVLRKPMEVTSPVGGVVAEIIPEEGAGVQYGDPLFVVQP